MTQPDPNAQAAPEPQQEPAPWGDDENFDPDKAKKLIANLRGENTKLKNREVLTDEHRQQLAEFEKMRQANQTELEKAQGELAQWQSDAEKWRTAAVASKAEALAAADFEYPDMAVGKLDLAKYLDVSGAIDTAAIRADLAQVLLDYPKLGREAAGPRSPRPNPSQGASQGNAPADPEAQFAAVIRSQLG